jgi:hypothetical protein
MPDDIIIPRHMYDDLINSANALVAVVGNAVETILSETPYESMLRGPNDAMKAALENVPGAGRWDGKWNEDDVEYTTFRHHSQPDRSGPDSGVKATHRPTGLSVESYMKPNADANQASALRGLRERVRKYAQQQGITT